MTDIIDTGDVAEINGDDETRSNMAATREEQPGGISFHVQMRSWTVDDMQDLIVEAAARLIVGRHGDTKIAKQIEERALSLITERADAKLSAVADNVLGTTLTPKGYDQKTPVTIGETIGMLGREYLEQLVNRDGKPAEGYDRHHAVKRLEHIVRANMDRKFADEMQKATFALISEVRAEIKARHEQLLAEERARIAEALAKL